MTLICELNVSHISHITVDILSLKHLNEHLQVSPA